MSKVRSAPDFMIIFATLFLLGIGIVMVYSASAIVATRAPFNDPYFFAKRQLIFALLGITSMYLMMNIDYWVWKQWAKLGFMISIGLLIVVLIIGIEVNGSKSWLGLGAFGIQPGEFAKLGVVAFLARWLADNQKQIVLFRTGLAPALAIPVVCFGLIMLQPDLGTGTVLMGTAVMMIFAAGARISHFVGLGLIGVMRFCRARAVGSLPDQTDHIVPRSLAGPAGHRLSNHSIALCDRPRRLVRPWARTEQTKAFLSAGAL